jgi:hypothetical protein
MQFIVLGNDDTYGEVGDSIVTDEDGNYLFVDELITFWNKSGRAWRNNNRTPAPVKQRVYDWLGADVPSLR